uniref:Uncharacterized protein n=1 Tax=Strigamia maritima TaxID=126957 RepID=T1JFW7_STRMM
MSLVAYSNTDSDSVESVVESRLPTILKEKKQKKYENDHSLPTDFESDSDENEPIRKKQKRLAPGETTLFALLPAPRIMPIQKLFIPDSVLRKPKRKIKIKAEVQSEKETPTVKISDNDDEIRFRQN